MNIDAYELEHESVKADYRMTSKRTETEMFENMFLQEYQSRISSNPVDLILTKYRLLEGILLELFIMFRFDRFLKLRI